MSEFYLLNIFLRFNSLQLNGDGGGGGNGGSKKGPDASAEALRQMLAQHMVRV